jgi:hypothetical protein
MQARTELSCACGSVRIEVTGAPILSVECCCTSCRTARAVFEARPGAPALLGEQGTSRYEMFRKDRVGFVAGREQLREFRLQPGSSTRRVVAACCNTPVFTEFQHGHWLSLYGGLWLAGTLPRLEMRTMAGDLPDGVALPADVPNLKSHSFGFIAKLMAAWIAMGFRSPKVEIAGQLEA